MKKIYLLMFFLSIALLGKTQTLTDTVSLKAFMDGLITAHMKEKNVAGATLAIVYKGKIVYKSGYGFSDIELQKPVDPDHTLFRIGSISKMFVWVSVMQLVADGKLDLNKDVNQYLKDFKIPETYPEPITLKHLMTHTPGFEDLVINLFAKDSTKLRPLNEILADEMPARIRAPYTQASYSNHGTAIAAHVVEVVSGISFHEYVQKNIITPLQMDFFTFSQPLPEKLKENMSEGYREVNHQLKKQDFEYVPLYPVGAASSSAESITHFMLALLNHGKYKDFVMLDSATLEFMKSPAHQHHPQVNPMRYGFMDLSQNGVTVIGHGGDTFWFHSIMALLPEHQTGIFLSVNTDAGGSIYRPVLEEFLDRYFPEVSPLKNPVKVKKEWLQQFAGEYEINRYPHYDLTKISALMSRLQISVLDSTSLQVSFGEDVTTFVPIDSSTFREQYSSETFAFEKDKTGNILHAYVGGLPIFAADKVSGFALASNQTLIFVLVICTAILTVLYFPLAYLMRRKYQRHTSETVSLPNYGKLLAWLNYFLLLVFILGVMITLSDPQSIVYGVPSSLTILLFLPLLMIVTTLLMFLFVFRNIRNQRYTLQARIVYLSLSIISVVALWQFNYWNFIGFNY